MNGDGKIDYGEFVNASMNRTKLINEKNLEMAFKLFDQDKDGVISMSELKEVFKGVAATGSSDDEEIWKRIMQELDTNNDNVISPKEFNEAMNKVLDMRNLAQFEQ